MKNTLQQLADFSKKVHQKGFFHLLSANFLIQLVAFASQLIVAGILSPDDIGRIKIIQTYLAILTIVAGMGFNASTLKLCSENRSKEEQFRLFRSSLYYTLVSTALIYLIVIILNIFGIFSPDKQIQWLFPLGLFPIISNSLFIVFTNYFQAKKEIITLSRLTIWNKLLSIGGIIVFTYWLGIKGYYIAYNISFILMLLVCFRIIKNNGKILPGSLRTDLPLHWQYAKSSILANLISEVASYVDILLINLLVNDRHEIGYYSFALTMTIILRIFPGTVQQIATPYFSSFSNDKFNFKRTFSYYNKILYAVVLVSLVTVCLLVPSFSHIVFHGKYDASNQYFLVLALSWSIRQLTQLQSGAIFGLGKIQYNAYSNLIVLIFNVLIVSVLLYYYGLMGAAVGSLCGNVLFVLISRYYYQKALKSIIE